MNNAVYNSAGVRLAGSALLPQALDEDIIKGKLPVYIDGVLYERTDDGYCALSVCSEAAEAMLSGRQANASFTEDSLFAAVLGGTVGVKQLTEECTRLRISPGNSRTVILIDAQPDPASIDIMKTAFESEAAVFSLGGGIAVVCVGIKPSELFDTASAVYDTFRSEIGKEVHVGVGEPVESLFELGRSREQAAQAIAQGRRLQPSGGVWRYKSLLPEMLLCGVDGQELLRFSPLLSRVQTAVDDETTELLDELFRQNLNISRTAAKLFMHRNTLIYRLEKLSKATGLDVSTFDDAVTLRMLIALLKQNFKQ